MAAPASTLRDAITNLGETISSGVLWCGGMSVMFAKAMLRGPRRPLGLFDISYQVLQLGIRSLPLATMMALFVGMILTWQFGEALVDFGAKNRLGHVTSLALVRELVPTLLAVTVGTKMATGMTAELGSMKVTEQIDALSALGADPIKKLVWPRIIGAAIAMPLLVAWGNVVAMLGGMLISDSVFDVPAEYFYVTYIDMLEPTHYVMSQTKGLAFGGLAGLIGCYQGFTTKFGTEAVGQSTTESVIATSVMVLLADFVLTTLFMPIGPV
ncbi:putative phospholipid ABC transporter permease protein MlaE [Enhygromyxa salina]|uniref:Putative phospholipid ABC transporter permease protein MlaE n=1 Tax=Enhygromyxa salina TaxID=215803 RepID=A0A2S9YB57_9BACT|nr:ABC transporter permease [Enhygromyxa salina]PRQ02344.1 putative phospholipid ABC transporter permease protein MlaE [Enhygromyxa salina]